MNLSHLDITILDWLNSHHIPGSVPVLQFISEAATFVSIGAVLAVLLLAWGKKSKPMLHNFFIMAIALLISALMIQLLKEVFDRERPFITFPFIEKLSPGGGGSFPSGHSMEAFAMAMVICVLFRRPWLSIPVYVWATLVAYSRLALGVHYPGDVLGGIITGSIIGWMVPWIYLKINSRHFFTAKFPPSKNREHHDR